MLKLSILFFLLSSDTIPLETYYEEEIITEPQIEQIEEKRIEDIIKEMENKILLQNDELNRINNIQRKILIAIIFIFGILLFLFIRMYSLTKKKKSTETFEKLINIMEKIQHNIAVLCENKKTESDIYTKPLHKTIYELKDKGFSEEEISKKLRIGKGETELILNLRKLQEKTTET